MLRESSFIYKYVKAILSGILFLLILFQSKPCYALEDIDPGKVELTEEERAYLETHKTLRISALDGAAPVISLDKDGEITGIAKSVTDRVGQLLGVEFVSVPTYVPEEVISIVQNGESDIVIIPANYAQRLIPDIPLTDPFLTAGTVLFYRNDLQPNELDDKKCVVVGGGNIPEGVEEKNVIYCDSRMESIRMVNDGEADYGYGNEFSVAYYAALKEYRNITTVPIRVEAREYCYGVIDSPLLVSALNKAIDAINTEEMQTIILGASVIPEQPITLQAAITEFAVPLTITGTVILLGLVFLLIYIYSINKNLKLQNKRLVTLAEVSGDLMFEYEIKTDELLLSRQFKNEFHIPEQSKPYDKSAIAGIIKIDDIIRRRITGEELMFSGSQYYNAVYSYIQGNSDMPLYLVGKLVDISVEKERIQALTNKAQIDGLTNVLNSAESKKMAGKNLSRMQPGQVDAFLMIDVDRFKYVNDTYGHYTGDQILIQVAAILRNSFRSQDVVGRFGGDEFMVYLCSIRNKELVIEKCRSLLKQLRIPLERGELKEQLSVSIGGYIIHGPEPFEHVYQKADQALYTAKKNGKGRYHIWSE